VKKKKKINRSKSSILKSLQTDDDKSINNFIQDKYASSSPIYRDRGSNSTKHKVTAKRKRNQNSSMLSPLSCSDSSFSSYNDLDDRKLKKKLKKQNRKRTRY
jgi:hypothetical protein